jgi:heat shock protein HslJ
MNVRPNERRMMNVLISMLIALSIFATGCGHDDGNSNVLAGTDWRLTAWSAGSLDPSQFAITVAFDDSQISGTSAVNSYGETYSANMNGDFSVGELQSTLMAGSDEAMHAERIYFELLEQARKYTVNKTTLTLLDGGNNALLVFTKR